MADKSIVGGLTCETSDAHMDRVEAVHKINAEFWDASGNETLGVNALPNYGAFISENEHHLFTDVSDKKVLEIGCGNGRSLKYMADLGANELWGIDISEMQIKRAEDYLLSQGVDARLICAPMEADRGIPKDYFDYVYAIYSIGWTTDLNKTFDQIASYLRKGGSFIFSWSHPIHKCVSVEKNQLVFCNSYFDESWYTAPLGDKNIMMPNRMLSTYINALAESGFAIERMIEENDKATTDAVSQDVFAEKAKMLPVTFVIKARKL